LEVWKMILLFKGAIFRFHVCFAPSQHGQAHGVEEEADSFAGCVKRRKLCLTLGCEAVLFLDPAGSLVDLEKSWLNIKQRGLLQNFVQNRGFPILAVSDSLLHLAFSKCSISQFHWILFRRQRPTELGWKDTVELCLGSDILSWTQIESTSRRVNP